MMDIIVCGSIPPYNQLLGGKLVSILACSPRVISDYTHRYERQISEIASRMKGERVIRDSRLGTRKTIYTEHYVEGYKSDIFIQDTNTIIEIKSVLSIDQIARFPTVFSERSMNQLEQLRGLLSFGYHVHYFIVSLNSYVKSIDLIPDAQFTPLLQSCVNLGMTLSAFSIRIINNKVCIDKKLPLLIT